MTEPSLPRSTSFDAFDDRRVEPDARVEAEVPAVHLAEPDRTEVVGVDAVGEILDSLDRVVRHAERASEHVGRPAGEDSEGGVGTGDARRDFVERAVAAESDDDVEPPPSGIVGESGGVTATVRLDHLDVVITAQASMHDHGVARRDRGGERIDDEQNLQGV